MQLLILAWNNYFWYQCSKLIYAYLRKLCNRLKYQDGFILRRRCPTQHSTLYWHVNIYIITAVQYITQLGSGWGPNVIPHKDSPALRLHRSKKCSTGSLPCPKCAWWLAIYTYGKIISARYPGKKTNDLQLSLNSLKFKYIGEILFRGHKRFNRKLKMLFRKISPSVLELLCWKS